MMDLLKKNFEKLILASGLVVLVVTAVILYLRAGTIANQIRNPASITGEISVDVIDKHKYDVNFQQITTPFQWAPYQHRLFAPSLIFKRPDLSLAIWEDLDKNKNDINDDWERHYGLPVLDSAQQDGESDYDGDDFSNREEYLDGTSPLDPESRPSYAMKLEVPSVADKSTTIRLSGAVSEKQSFVAFLNVSDPHQQSSPRVRKGDIVADHKVVDFVVNAQRSVTGIILKRDLPGDIPQTLEIGKEIVLTDKSCEILNKVSGETETLRETESWEFRGEKFSVIKIDTQSRKVIIQDATGKTYTLPFPSPKSN